MDTTGKKKGPLWHRLGIRSLAIILTLLFVWLLGFVVDDMGKVDYPDFQELELVHVGQELLDRRDKLTRDQEDLRSRINGEKEMQQLLQTSTRNSQQTMNQLLHLYEENLRRDIQPTAAEQDALAEAEQRFLENQGKFQALNEQIVNLSEEHQTMANELKMVTDQITEKQVPAREEYQVLLEAARMKSAIRKLAFLIPVLLISAGLVYRLRESAYAPIFYAALVASFWRTGLIMHAYFPREYFKYIAIITSIIIILAFMVKLIRMISRPRIDWLLRQYREAYQRRRCPACDFPIRRGMPGEILSESGKTKGILPILLGNNSMPETPYSCPSCGHHLYEICDNCDGIRHSMLPYCEHCSTEKECLT